MRSDLLKQTEIFIFLALVFSIFVALISLNNNKMMSENGVYVATIDSLINANFILDSSYTRICEEYGNVRSEVDSLEDALAREALNSLYHVIQDAHDNNYFGSGSAKITSSLRSHIFGITIPGLEAQVAEFPEYNCITIVGHTDHIRKYDANRNFDREVLNALRANRSFNHIRSNSNSDLGLLRSCAVYSLLMESPVLKNSISYWHPLSAGPFIDESNSRICSVIENIDNPSKRRIEIRLSKR